MDKILLILNNLRTGLNDDMPKKDVFKNNASFRSCITKISDISIDNVKDLDIVMWMYNLLEVIIQQYSSNYSMTSIGLWNYYRVETDNVDDDDLEGKSFKLRH